MVAAAVAAAGGEEGGRGGGEGNQECRSLVRKMLVLDTNAVPVLVTSVISILTLSGPHCLTSTVIHFHSVSPDF